MNHATALAGAGAAAAARAEMTRAEALLCQDGDAVPYLMLSRAHLARWQGHCLTVLGDPAAVGALEEARAAEGDSLRAAVGLHTDLAIALDRERAARRCGQQKSTVRLVLAQRGGSVRQRKRLRLSRTRSPAD